MYEFSINDNTFTTTHPGDVPQVYDIPLKKVYGAKYPVITLYRTNTTLYMTCMTNKIIKDHVYSEGELEPGTLITVDFDNHPDSEVMLSFSSIQGHPPSIFEDSTEYQFTWKKTIFIIIIIVLTIVVTSILHTKEINWAPREWLNPDEWAKKNMWDRQHVR